MVLVLTASWVTSSLCPWIKTTKSVLLHHRVIILLMKFVSMYVQRKQICHLLFLWTHQPITLKAEQPETQWHSEIVMVDQIKDKFLHQMTQAASLCTNDAYPVNSCSSGSRFISLQTDSTKNEFRPKLRGVTVWALYLNSKQHSRGHNFQPTGKKANLPISY